MSGTPIKLTLYDNDDQSIKELSRTVVPWGLLKKALHLASGIDPDNLKEEDVDALAGLVTSVFGEDRVTVQELDRGADITDMMAVMNQIIAKAESLMPNPPNPGKLPREQAANRKR